MREILGLAVLAWPQTLLVGMALIFVVAIMVTLYFARNKKRAWPWVLGVSLLMYLAVFWDHIPTVVAHKYYCDKEAGFWVDKTVDQWKQENPGVMETLVTNKGAPSTRQGDMQNFTDIYFLNQRINKVVKKTGSLPFNRWRWEHEVIDIQTGEVLARYVDFSTGNGNISGADSPVKFWLQRDHCNSGDLNYGHFLEFKDKFLGGRK